MNLWLSLISVLFVVFLPVTLAIVLRRRFQVPWLYFCVGILTFLGAQAVHLPLNALLEKVGILRAGATETGELVLMATILALTAALTEELARAVGYALVRRARRFEDGLMMGLGHGGIEAMIVGVLMAASATSVAFLLESGTLPTELSPEKAAALTHQLEIVTNTPLVAIAPAVERVIALVAQVSLSVVVLQAFVRRNWLYVAAAILFHGVFDFVAVYAGRQLDNVWLLLGLLALLVFPLAFWVWRIRPSPSIRSGEGRFGISQELNALIVSISKELVYQWRTRRALIVWAVFLTFGMLSPLLAKFTPQLLGSLEGAEQIAELIPDPTASDAVGQYIKNLTQFGFILAILLGMGAIAGEKEKGTAAMMLSKPLPRWTFVLSKFTAQSTVYLVGFVLAAFAAYYYTVVLFEAVNVVNFIVVNALLFSWLLVFTAITLLGSVIGKTTAAAAGIALLCSVFVLLVGSIPQYGVLTPGGLVTWAGQLAIGEMLAPNAGALATSLVLVLLALITALAIFEKQEV